MGLASSGSCKIPLVKSQFVVVAYGITDRICMWAKPDRGSSPNGVGRPSLRSSARCTRTSSRASRSRRSATTDSSTSRTPPPPGSSWRRRAVPTTRICSPSTVPGPAAGWDHSMPQRPARRPGGASRMADPADIWSACGRCARRFGAISITPSCRPRTWAFSRGSWAGSG